MSAAGRLNLTLEQQYALGDRAESTAQDLMLTIAMVPGLAAFATHTAGPLYERIEPAVKLAPVCCSPVVRQRLTALWGEINGIHQILLLSLLDLAGHWASKGANTLRHHGLADTELDTVAQLGALRGIRRWQSGRRRQLGTYCRNWIRKEVLAEVDRRFKTDRIEGHAIDTDTDRHADPSLTATALVDAEIKEARSAALTLALQQLHREDPDAAFAVALRFGLVEDASAARRIHARAATRGLRWLREQMVAGP